MTSIIRIQLTMTTIKQELHDHLSFLTTIQPARNWMNRSSLTLASDYLSDTFKSQNYPVEEQKWQVGKFEYTNIIAKYKPHLKERLIVGANYDLFSDQPGADDNGSGVAGLLVLSNLVAQHQPNLPYGIDFVSYCLEEPPHFGSKNMGSYIHANSFSEQKTPVIEMICLDMIGYFNERPDSQQYPKAEYTIQMPRIGNFIRLVGVKKYTNFNETNLLAMQREDTVQTRPIIFPTSDELAGLSDHRNYWYFDYAAVMISDTAIYRNPNYHENDTTLKSKFFLIDFAIG